MILTLVSPGQWALWLAIGIAWEWFECYTFCFKDLVSCSGMYDVTANIAGVAIAMWIHSQVKIETLYCRNGQFKELCKDS